MKRAKKQRIAGWSLKFVPALILILGLARLAGWVNPPATELFEIIACIMLIGMGAYCLQAIHPSLKVD